MHLYNYYVAILFNRHNEMKQTADFYLLEVIIIYWNFDCFHLFVVDISINTLMD